MNFKEIADRAVAILGVADPLQYQAAYDVMVAETFVENVTIEIRVTEGDVIRDMGRTAGNTFLAKLTPILSPAENRLLLGAGIDVIHQDSKQAMADMLAGNVITQSEYDWVASHYTQLYKVWPGLQPGHVQNALEMRQKGVI